MQVSKQDMEITVVKEFTFDAGHHLPNYDGKCRNPHGHTYKLQMGFKGKVNPETGMVVDFSDLSRTVRNVIVDQLDHQYLNNLNYVYYSPFPKENPTAENMVLWMAELFTVSKLTTPAFIRLYETPTSYAEWRA